MKKTIIATLSLVSLCFASEGAVDMLASWVISLFFAGVVVPAIFCFCYVVFYTIVDFFAKMKKD